LPSIVNFYIEEYDLGHDKDGNVTASIGWKVLMDGSPDGDTPDDIANYFGIYPGDPFGGDVEMRAATLLTQARRKMLPTSGTMRFSFLPSKATQTIH
jgi:hypothetical protein